MSDYLEFRGKCKEMSEQLVRDDPTLILVRGYYDCPTWGRQPHWWCKKPDGTIVDPTVRQFPTAGVGADYEEYDGTVFCEYCGASVHEHDAYFVGHHVYCCDEHYGRDIGF
jgi:hypothetical protein